MPRHSVKKGECLSKIAAAYGLPTWRTIYDDPANEDFRRLRPNPNLIYPNDLVFVPEPAPDAKEESGASGLRHRFRMQRPTMPIKISVDRPWASDLGQCRYELSVEGMMFDGEVSSGGVIEHDVPIDTQVVELTLHPFEGGEGSCHFSLRVSDLDPVETTRGIQQRLNALWFFAGPDDGIEGPKTRTGTRCFQRRYGLVVDGIPGLKTQAKLAEIYGC